MPRWQSDTQQRLVQAALELYAEQGYEGTTVGEIAQRVGVTSRTYFRYFPDKREVLFASGQALREAIVAAARDALRTRPPYDALLTGITASRSHFLDREFVRTRDAVIATSEELRERELVKLAAITVDFRELLLEVGCDEATARMTADAGVAVFLEATRRWQAGDDAPFEELVASAAQLLRETAATSGAPSA